MATSARRIAAAAAVARLWVRATPRSVGGSNLSPAVGGSSGSRVWSDSATPGKLLTRQTVRVSWAEQWREVNRAMGGGRVPIPMAGERYDVPASLPVEPRHPRVDL